MRESLADFLQILSARTTKRAPSATVNSAVRHRTDSRAKCPPGFGEGEDMDQPAAAAGKNWLPDFTFTITDSGTPPPGPGFTMSRDDARSMLNLARQAREQFGDMRNTAAYLTKLTPPADEPASTGYNRRLTGDGSEDGAFGAGLAAVTRMYDYANQLVRKLEQALSLTESADETATADVKAAGSEASAKGFAG
ncbi:hypothetical protein [Amycolatopsis sp. GA6-003]|uniref:hypothetical protein n=1 Tax=Amycolatopsis sp. GA6-003 TaxID=2652444 RepID=UPI0039174889